MWTVLVSVISGFVLALGLMLGHVLRHPWEAIVIGLAAAVVVAVVLLRRVSKRLDPMMKTVEKHITGGRRELALKTLRDGMALGRWHPLLPSQLRVQLGVIEYVGGDLERAEEELSKASRWPWLSRAYLGCVYFKRREEKKMRAAFDTAIRVGDKEGIAYTLYAWCLLAQGQRADAVKILERGLKKLPGDHRLQNNLELAKEGKKLKVAPYGDAWSRFQLDGGGSPLVPKVARGFATRPGFRERPKRR